jgi:hypothetical protein
MVNSNVKYKKTQFAYWILVIIMVSIFFIIYLNETPNVFLPVIILSLTFILFHKLTIIIDEEKIIAYFGYNFFKREMKINEIDPLSIQTIKINWLTGLGIRITNIGWLYNVKYGEAIKIISKDKSNFFFVGTDDSIVIKKILLELIKENKHL